MSVPMSLLIRYLAAARSSMLSLYLLLAQFDHEPDASVVVVLRRRGAPSGDWSDEVGAHDTASMLPQHDGGAFEPGSAIITA